MKRIHLILGMLSTLVVFPFLCFPEESISDEQRFSLNPEKTKELTEKETEISIRANIYNASVYLNGEYQGVTPLTISGLMPGCYDLLITGKGYEKRHYAIFVKKGESLSYYASISKITGLLLITGAPDSSMYYADGSRQYTIPMKLEEGFHQITVRKFGFKELTTTVFIAAHTIQTVSVTMTPVAFSISNFSVSRKRFNPDYSGSFGNCSFSFSVTAPGSGSLSITDSSGNIVYTKLFPDFTTWEQRFKWNGCDDSGNKLPAGTYSAKIAAGDCSETVFTKIDYSLTLTPFDVTMSSTGIGTLPAAFMIPENTFYLSTAVSPVFRTSSVSFYEVPLSITFGYTPVSWLECSVHVNMHMGITETPLSFGAAAKFTGSVPTGDTARFCYGALIRYGILTSQQLYYPFGTDTGQGLGGSIITGFENEKFYIGLASEYLYSAETGNLTSNDSVWRNGINFQIKPMTTFSLNTWCALDSAYHVFNETTRKSTDSIIWFRALDTGTGISAMIGSSSCIFNINARTLIFFGSTYYFSGTIGFTYLF
jgi:hypothetical protein